MLGRFGWPHTINRICGCQFSPYRVPEKTTPAGQDPRQRTRRKTATMQRGSEAADLCLCEFEECVANCAAIVAGVAIDQCFEQDQIALVVFDG